MVTNREQTIQDEADATVREAARLANLMTLEGLRQEINAAIDVVEPQISGLENAGNDQLSAPTLQAVSATLATHVRRRKLLNDVIKALDAVDKAVEALTADGYPEMAKLDVTQEIYDELQNWLADDAKAVREFQIEPPAVTMSVSLGQPAEKV